MTAERTVVKNNGVVRAVRGLQSRSHLARMQRVTIFVCIPGNDEGGWVSGVVLNLMVRRVTIQHVEVFSTFGSSEFVPPNMRVIEKVIAQHVQHGSDAYHCSKQVGPLGKSDAHQQSGVRTSKNGEFFRCGVSARYKPLGR